MKLQPSGSTIRSRRSAPRLKPVGIGLPPGFGAPGDHAQAGFGVEKLGAAGKGEGFLDRVENLDQMSTGAICRQLADPILDDVDRVEQIGEQDHIRKPFDRRRIGQRDGIGKMAEFGGDALSRVAAGGRFGQVEQADAFAGTGQQFGQGEQQDQGAVPF